MHRNLLDMQRAMAWKVMGEQARQLLEEGYAVDADRILDEMIRRRETGTVEPEYWGTIEGGWF